MAVNKNSSYGSVGVTNHIFNKYWISVKQAVPNSVMQKLADRHMDGVIRSSVIEEWPLQMIDGLVYSLGSYLLKSQHIETQRVEVKVPKTWWDHLKHDFAQSHKAWQRWLASKTAPPEYRFESKEVETVIRVCPHNDYLSENPQAHFEFLEWKNEVSKVRE